MTDRLAQQFAFLNEADRLKTVLRSNVLVDLSRRENSAEHSWHVALYAMVFGASDRAIAMLLLHDLVEIDVGDFPIEIPYDVAQVAADEAVAATRLFGLLPDGAALHALWSEFETAETPDARFAKRIDHAQPLFQTMMAHTPRPDLAKVVADNLAHGRCARFVQEWPECHAAVAGLLDGIQPTGDLGMRLSFLREADALKSVLRATTICDGSRPENSGEHSWHLALYALVLSDQAGPEVDIGRVIRMLILHDLVEIDTGDVPIHSAAGMAHASVAQMAAEAAAAERIFGLLPAPMNSEFRILWEEFEAALTPDALFAKALDRVQPVMQNIACGGGTWTTYNVTADQLDTRVGGKIARGAPALWPWVRARAAPFFETV